MEHNCLILSPFSKDYLQLKDKIKEYYSQSSIHILHAADLPLDVPLIEGSTKLLITADIVLADISTPNPNIYYEIGHAQGLNIPIILFATNGIEIPFDLSTFRIIRYETFSELMPAILKSLSDYFVIKESNNSLTEHEVIDSQKTNQIIQGRNPFNNLVAESIDANSFLSLYVEPPFFKELTRPLTTVIVGSRGCGKTTLLRKIQLDSYDTIANKHTEYPSELLAFYINFNTSFRFLGIEKNVFSKEDRVMKYFNLLFVQSILSFVDKLYSDENISDNEATKIISIFFESIGVKKPSNRSIPKMVLSLTKLIIRERHNYQTENSKSRLVTTSNYLGDLIDNLKMASILFSKKQVAFLLDDYASDWLPEEVCSAINQIIFRRTSNYFFKIATIPGRYLFSLGSNIYADFLHDYDLINIDVPFITNDLKNEEYLCKIITKRLKYFGSQFDSQHLLNSAINDEQLSDYSGTKNLAKLYSGDIRSLLTTCSRMISNSDNFQKPISRHIQNTTIEKFSREKIVELNVSFDQGKFAVTFLNMIIKLSMGMVQPSKSKSFSSYKFKRLDGFQIKGSNKLSKKAQERLQWLIRCGLIRELRKDLDMEQYIIGRIYFPAFHIPISGSGHILPLKISEIESMLINPEEFWTEYLSKIT